MPVDSFQQLCDQFSELAGSPPRPMTENAEGLLVFSCALREVGCSVLHVPSSDVAAAHVLLDFGPLPAGSEEAAMGMLMLTNFHLLGEPGAPSFSLHPVFGNVTLQLTYPFAQASGTGLMHLLNTLAGLALQWRQTHFLDGADPWEGAAGAAFGPACAPTGGDAFA